MRRENRGKNKFNSSASVYIIGGVLLVSIAAFVIGFILYSNKLDNDSYALDSEYLSKYTDNNTINTENTTSASSSIGKTVEESSNTAENTSSGKEKKDEKTNNDNKKSTKENIVKSSKTEKDPSFQSPIKGQLIKEYAKDNLTYSETLKEWTTHLGVDIKSEKANVVMSAADGTVKYIKNDPRYGLTIIIEHNNGFETLYANLLTTEFVSEGEKVKAGQTIGTVGDSAVYEIVDEPHLHFEILKNSKNVNPKDYVKFE